MHVKWEKTRQKEVDFIIDKLGNEKIGYKNLM